MHDIVATQIAVSSRLVYISSAMYHISSPILATITVAVCRLVLDSAHSFTVCRAYERKSEIVQRTAY
jgi:hypothetical protein